MTDISKLTKKQLLEVVEGFEENRWDDFKEEFGISYNTSDEWIDFFKSIRDKEVLPCEDCEKLKKEIKDLKYHLDNHNSIHTRG
tara:strand:+ start:128 stop:379 length:252 start_codon:yes stop_codon:yes gene_type:complete